MRGFRWSAVVALLALFAAACGNSGSASQSAAPTPAGSAAAGVSGTVIAPAATVAAAPTLNTGATLTLYNAQNVSMAEAWVADFTKQTGIKVQVRSGKDLEMANQIVQEGSASPADVFITENSPAMSIVSNKGLFAKVDETTARQVPVKWSSPNGDWVGIAARSTVLVYNPSMLPEASLPKSLMDLSAPEWKGKYGVAATGADFQAIVSAVLALKGQAATSDWLKGLKANAKIYSGNGAVMRAVNSGEIAAGVIYHYYWYKDQLESGANSNNTKLFYFTNQDPGAFLSVSGGGVLKSSKNPREAQALLAYLTSKAGQQLLASSTALEYSIGSQVASHPNLKPLSELAPPDIDLSKLNGPQVVDMMQQAGLL